MAVTSLSFISYLFFTFFVVPQTRSQQYGTMITSSLVMQNFLEYKLFFDSSLFSAVT